MPEVLQLRLAEYESLRGEIATAMNEARALERYALATVGAICAWYATRNAAPPPIAWWLPVALVAFGGLRSLALQLAIARTGEYLHAVESAYFIDPSHSESLPSGAANKPTRGWEHFLREHAIAHRWKMNAAPYFTTGALYWLALLGVTVCIAANYDSLLAFFTPRSDTGG